MISHSLTLNERRYIRSRVRKKVNDNIKRKIAQKIVETAYQKHDFNNYLASLPKKDLRGIIETYESNRDLVRLGVKIIENKINTGSFTRSKANVNQILREHRVINKKGLIKESWAEFGLDMLFGIAPAIASLPPVIAATGGTSATVGVGLGVAGMIYYGFKFGKDASVKNTLGMIINGMSFIFSAAEVFPMVGTAVAFVGKQVMRVLKAVFGGLFKLVAVPLKGLVSLGGSALAKLEVQGISKIIAAGGEGAGKSLIPFIEKAGLGTAAELEKLGAEELIKMGEKIVAGGGTSKVLSEAAKEGLEETGKEALKNVDKFKSLKGILDKGAGLMQKATAFLAELAGKAANMPVIGKFAGAIEKGLLAVEKNTAFILTRSEQVALAVEKGAANGCSDEGVGALIKAAADVESEAAKELLEVVAAREAKVATAAKEMGLLEKMGIDIKAIHGGTSKEIDAAIMAGGADAAAETATEIAETMIKNLKSLESAAGQKLAQNMETLLQTSLKPDTGVLKNVGTFFANAEKEILEATLGLADETAAITGNALTDIIGAAGKEIGEYTVRGAKMGEKGLEIVVSARGTGSAVAKFPVPVKEFLKKGGPEAAKLIDDVGKEVAGQLSRKASQEAAELGIMRTATEGTQLMAREMADQSAKYLAKGGNNTIAMFAALSGAHPAALEKVVLTSAGSLPKLASIGASSDAADITRAGKSNISLDPEERAAQVRSMYGDYNLNESLRRKSLRYLY